MKRIKRLDLSNVVGGQAANLLAQGQASVNYRNCLTAATTKADKATSSAFSQVNAGTLAPQQGVQAGVAAGRTLQSDVAACGQQFPIPQ